MEERKQLEHSYSDGTKYTGAVMAGADRWTGAKDMWIYDGTGKLVWQGGCWSGTSFVGEWKSHAVDGRGVIQWPDGSSYEGEFVNHQRHGSGTFRTSDGTCLPLPGFDGSWDNGQFTGFGKAVFYGGCEWYEGNFINDVFHGKGKYHFNDGSTYEGDWERDHMHGTGTYRFTAESDSSESNAMNGSYYEGQFLGDKFHGKGCYVWTDGRMYDGEWENDRMTGFGTFWWPNGDHYEGEWKDGKFHGQGKYHWAEDGRSYSGKWENDKPVDTKILRTAQTAINLALEE